MSANGGNGLPIVECFTTLQGEGPAAGRPATFIRTGGCNLSCTWCDTPYTWDATRFDMREQITRWDVDAILERVTTELVVITGGEPLLHQRSNAWAALLAGLTGRTIHVETNGTLTPEQVTRDAVHLAVVSPKLAHADAGRRTNISPMVPAALRAWADLAWLGRAALKVVVRDEHDCRVALSVADMYGYPRTAVWLMPEGTTPDGLGKRWPEVAQFAAEHRVNATHRLHVLAWGDERGH